MPNKKLTILKIGGSVITQKKERRKKIDKKILERLSLEISNAKKKKNFSLIITHGVGPFGHIIAEKFKLHKGYRNKSQIEAVANLYVDLKKLNLEILKIFKSSGLNVVPFQQSSAWKLNNGRLKNPNMEIVQKYLNIGLTPILHGDLLIDDKLGFSVLSGDQIVYCLAKKLGARRVVIGTDVDGVFDSDPRLRGSAKLLKRINSSNLKGINMGGSTAVDVTGGMKGKINELMELSRLGIKSRIINISKTGVLEDALCGKKNLGTEIL